MIRKVIAMSIIAILVVGFHAMSGYAYTVIGSPASVTATGTIAGSSVSFACTTVIQSTGAGTTPAQTITFSSPSAGTITDSGAALKIDGGANYVNTRLVIYTDNASYYSTGHDPAIGSDGKVTGVDGAGMPGASEAAYAAAMLWGVKCDADLAPNTNMDYVFDTAYPPDGVNETYIVDKRHTHSFVPLPDTAGLDTQVMYTAAGVAVPNPANEGYNSVKLYPQRWDEDLYDSTVPATRVVVSEALYKNIATVAFSVEVGSGADAGYYICQVPKISTVSGTDSVKARLRKTDNTAGSYLYLYVAGDFVGKPAQAYTTTKLTVALVYA